MNTQLKTIWLVTTFLAASLLTGCSPAADLDSPVSSGGNPKENGEDLPMPTSTPIRKEMVRGGSAMVDTLQVLLMESFPVQVSAEVSGNLPDACTTIERIKVERTGDTFTLELITQRPPETMCAQVLTRFEEKVSLDVEGLEAGTYFVKAGNQQVSFTLEIKNKSEPSSGG